jgi:hypothetical protein
MSESTLSLTRLDLKKRAALFLRFPLSPAKWQPDHNEQLNIVVDDGLVRFYKPIPGGKDPYEWSFLRPSATLVTVSGTGTYALPDDFGGNVDKLIVTGGGTSNPIDLIATSDLLQLKAAEGASNGLPRFAAFRRTTAAESTTSSVRYELLLYPTPDDAYTLTYSYPLLPNAPTDATYLLGGMQHHQTMVESVLAVAEEYLDAGGEGNTGTHAQMFQVLLSASVEQDRLAWKMTERLWPSDEPPIGSYHWYARRIGQKKGFGFNRHVWSFAQAGEVDEIVQRGLKQFYTPPPLQSEGGTLDSHKWSFLTPVKTLSVVQADNEYDLPADFTGFRDVFSYSVGSTKRSIVHIDESEMRSKLAVDSSVQGPPKYFALRPKASDGSASQLYEAVFHPVPDASYTLTYRPKIDPPIITGSNPYPLGGGAHSETILASCLSVCAMGGEEYGPAMSYFMQRLAASIESDKSVEDNKVQSFDDSVPAFGSYKWLQQEIGLQLGIGASFSTWGAEQIQKVNALIQRGVQVFYHPASAGIDGGLGHRWSFLYPTGTLTTQAPYTTGTVSATGGVATLVGGTWPAWAADGTLLAAGVAYEVQARASDTELTLANAAASFSSSTYSLSQSTYSLPEDLLAIDGPFIFDSDAVRGCVPVTDYQRLSMEKRQRVATGIPYLSNVRTEVDVLTTGTRLLVEFYPYVDAAYTLTYRYRRSVPEIAVGQFPLGGIEHAETILAACSYVADPKSVDHFKNLLASSIYSDRGNRNADTLGYNGDRSDNREGIYDRHRMSGQRITVEGQSYD